jgi:hypothetical protein
LVITGLEDEAAERTCSFSGRHVAATVQLLQQLVDQSAASNIGPSCGACDSSQTRISSFTGAATDSSAPVQISMEFPTG